MSGTQAVATDTGVNDANDDTTSLAERLAAAGAGDVLLYGPAMSGKGEIGLDLLVNTVTDADARGSYVVTNAGAGEARQRLEARLPAAVDLPRPGVVGCQGAEVGDELTRGVETPGDLTGLATVLTAMYDDSRRSRRLGSCLLIDSVSDLLIAADLEPVYRFLHALLARVEEAGGTTVATLDTDGLDGGERPALTGLFDTVVKVRHLDGRTEYRLATDEEWHGYLPEDGV